MNNVLIVSFNKFIKSCLYYRLCRSIATKNITARIKKITAVKKIEIKIKIKDSFLTKDLLKFKNV